MRELHSVSSYLLWIKTGLFCFFILGISSKGFSQKSIEIYSDQGEALLGAEATNQELNIYVSSDESGLILLPKTSKPYQLTIKYLGFKTTTVRIDPNNQKTRKRVLMYPNAMLLKEFVVIGRSDTKKEDLPYQVDILDIEMISSTEAQSTVDALQVNANVFVQKSQMGGGSPVIRGFEANKVLLVVDGVRMNNAIYRSGHLQNAITVDESMLEQVELIYGPGSVSYGSDALGGVIHFRTKKPRLNLGKENKVLSGQYYLRSASANTEKSGHIDFNIGGRKWAALTSISFSDFGDLRSGNNRRSKYPEFGKRLEYVERLDGVDQIIQSNHPNLQIGTGFRQWDILQKVLFQANPHLQFEANFQHSNSSDVPRYDALNEYRDGNLRYAEWNYGPQTRNLFSVRSKWEPSFNKWIDQWINIISVQNVRESRITRFFENPWRNSQVEKVNVQSFTSDIQKSFNTNWKHQYQVGVSIDLNQVESNASEQNIETNETNEYVFTRYPSGGSTMNSFGAYASYSIMPMDSIVRMDLGVRFTQNALYVQFSENDPFEWPAYFYEGIPSENNAWGWSSSVQYKPIKSLILQGIVSSAFRSPNIDDLGKTRIQGNEISVPNVDLDAESTNSFELNLSQKFQKKNRIQLTGYYTLLRNAIVRENFQLPDGAKWYVVQGDSLQVVANVNAQQATIRGASISLFIEWNKRISSSTSFNIQEGRIREDDSNTSPLGHIPPLFGSTKIQYKGKKLDIKLISLYNGWKRIEDFGGSVDNPEFATLDGSPSWIIFNTYLSYKVLDNLTLSAGLENIFDTHYRPFSSGVSAPGLNGILSIRGSF